ncbi:MAG: hypothetical protein OXP28_04450 [Gammaproteobacteria bacterium]|nr:hypothetical protein [Gammaproteobacteria bacterium]MDE0224369.1 hypothetical protein [Gammaproteobacteria bacterium]MDE0451790.1 hypothetical protein [Gammaproteobacteria bacterium]
MVKSVFIPEEYAGPASELPERTPMDNQEFGKGDAELDRKLSAIRQRRSNALMDAVARFAEDPYAREMVNLGRGPGNPDIPPANAEQLEKLIEMGAGTQGIFAAHEPADMDVYRSFLPPPLQVPEVPMVGTTLLDMNREASDLTRFQEGRITVKALCPDGIESWLLLSAPVPTLYHTREGVVWGWPKYVADQITFTPRRAEARYEGSVRYSLDFAPGPVDDEGALRALGRVEGGSSISWHWIQGGSVLLRGTGRGGGAPSRELAWEPGMVTVYIRPEDPWSKLIPENATVPGFYSRWIGGGGDAVRQKVCTVRGGEIIYPEPA